MASLSDGAVDEYARRLGTPFDGVTFSVEPLQGDDGPSAMADAASVAATVGGTCGEVGELVLYGAQVIVMAYIVMAYVVMARAVRRADRQRRAMARRRRRRRPTSGGTFHRASGRTFGVACSGKKQSGSR